MQTVYTDTVLSRKPNYTDAAILTVTNLRQGIPMGYAETLKALRKKAGLSQAKLAEKVGVEQPTVQRWESGNREPTISMLTEIAKILDVDPSAFFMNSIPLGPQLSVKGSVAAGVWLAAVEWPESDWQTFTGRGDVQAELEHRFGLKIEGDSMNLLYPPGTIVECVSVFGRAEIEPGKRVVIIRTNANGEHEATVKELVEQDGKLWAVPRSTNPAFQPICLEEPENDVIETRITAIVVASIRPE